MLSVEISNKLKESYPESIFGSLIIKGIENQKKHIELENQKRKLEDYLRKNFDQTKEDKILINFKNHFGRWNKTYPIEFQIQSILKGKNLPQVSILVDSMFHAELKNRILTSGHDLDDIKGRTLIFDSSRGNEEYTKINGKNEKLKEDDIFLRDEEGILANVLYGPAKRSSISMNTKNVIYFAWCIKGIKINTVRTHLENISANLEIVYPNIISEINIHSPF